MGGRSKGLTFAANCLYVAACVLLARIVVRFFGVLATSVTGSALIDASGWLVLPLGLRDALSLHGGVFDLEASATVIVLLTGEWLVSRARARMRGESDVRGV